MTRAMTTATLMAWVAFCQSAAGPPAFDVASVKSNASTGSKPGKGTFLPGRVAFPNGTLKLFIMAAFQVRSDMIEGGPDWLDSERFDIVAKASPETDEKTLRTMFQTLLAERFKLAVRRKDRVMPDYALTVAKSGAKLEPSATPGERHCTWENADHGLRRRVCSNMTMADLASALPGWGGIGIDRPVVDMTGLKGAYDFHFEVSVAKKPQGGGEVGGKAVAVKDDSGPTIFDALGKLGLKLESRKDAVSTLVIEHAEKPSQN